MCTLYISYIELLLLNYGLCLSVLKNWKEKIADAQWIPHYGTLQRKNRPRLTNSFDLLLCTVKFCVQVCRSDQGEIQRAHYLYMC